MYVGNDGGVVKSTDAGQKWTNLNQNFPGALLYGVALSRDGTMIAGTQDNGVIFSDPRMPYGRTWYAIHGGDSAHNLIDPTDSRVAYLTMYGKDTWKRVTRAAPGATPGPEVNIRPSQFEVIDSACSFFPTFSMNPRSPRHLVAACQRVVRTLDGTASPVVWTTIGNGPPPSGSVTAVVTAATEAPSNSDVIYAVTNYDTVFVTSNAGLGNGARWQQITQFRNPGGISTVKVDPTNYQIAYLAADSGIYKTTDMGTSWTQYGISNAIYRDVAIDPAYPQHIFAASNAGVFASTDGGSNWGDMSEGIPTGMVVSSLSFNAASRQLAASTYGRGVYLLDVTRPVLPIPAASHSASQAMISKDCMINSMSIIPTCHDAVRASGHAISWDGSSVNGIHAHANGARTFLMKVSNFLTELKRRKVYRVAVAYGVVSWLLIQAASIFLPTFDAPPCMMKAVVVFLALGFILSAILSWVFDITPQGIKRTADISPDEAVDIVRQLEAQARQEFVRGYLSALIYAGLGDKTKAIDYLKREYLNHDNINATGIRVDAMLDGLRGDPRFEELMERPQ